MNCKICGRGSRNIQCLIMHVIKKHKWSSKEYYDNFIKKPDEGKCRVCRKGTTYHNASKGYLKQCSTHRCNTSKGIHHKSEFKSGNLHPNWAGGISFEPHNPSFNKALKEQIRQRDNYQCQDCGILQKDLGRKLDVHHIDYDKKNDDPMNLISLCKSCHMKTNYNKEDWIDYYQGKEERTDLMEAIELIVDEDKVVFDGVWTPDLKDLWCNLCPKKDTSECEPMRCSAANPWCG